MEVMSSWDNWVQEALSKLQSLHLLRSLRPIYLRNDPQEPTEIQTKASPTPFGDAYEVFEEMQQWDRSSVEIEISDATFQKWVLDISSSGINLSTPIPMAHNLLYNLFPTSLRHFNKFW